MSGGTTRDFEADRQRHLRAFAAGLAGEAERLTWPLERLHGLRDARLRALLRTAVTRSAWHRSRLAGVDLDAVTGADLARLPTMTKADVMERWDEIVTDRRLSLELAEGHLERVVADMRRAFVAAAHATHPTSIVTRTFAGSPQLGVSRSFPVTLPLSEIVAGLNDFGPTHLFAYPSMMHRLAGELRAGRLRISPRELNCGAEPLVADARAQIEAAFARPVINLYAAAEAGVIARSYPGSAGLHLNEDIAVYEPVDAHDRPVPAGTRGAKLLVTNVVNHALPLIRYELNDEVTMLVEPNPDPWTGRRIADPEGRVDGAFTYDGGVEVHLHLFRSALGRRRQVLEYQVRQTPAGADIALRTVAPLDCDALRLELVEGLATLGIARPQVRIDAVDEIERAGSTGKLRRFVPLAHERR